MRFILNVIVSFILMGVSSGTLLSLDCKSMEILMIKAHKDHYSSINVDKDFMEKAFLDYLDILDPDRIYFYSEDVSSWIEDIENIDLGSKTRMEELCSIIERVSRTYSKRVQDIQQYSQQTLEGISSIYDVTIHPKMKTIELDSSKVGFFSSREIYDLRVKPILRYDLVSTMNKGASLEEAVEGTISYYRSLLTRVVNNKPGIYYDKFFQAFLKRFDPHSNYEPEFGDNLVDQNSDYVGFGIEIHKDKGNRYYVESILKKASEELHKNIKPGDEIIAITNPRGEWVDIVGMEGEEVDKLIRGPEGSRASFSFRKIEGFGTARRPKIINLELTRKKIQVTEDTVYGDIYYLNSGYSSDRYKIGVLTIKSFMLNYAKEDGQSVSEAVLSEIKSLNEANVEGMIVDLRGNGGGIVDETIKILNYFLDKPTPAAWIKRHSKAKIMNMTSESLESELVNNVFTKPLVVLIDKLSASASEIFAAAIQDLGRGIVIGGTSYGKASMQSLIPVNVSRNEILTDKEYRHSYTLDPSRASLRLTINRIYRLSGKSLQNVGVDPDIKIPFINDMIQYKSERELPGSFKPDTITPPLKIKPYSAGKFIPFLTERFDTRFEKKVKFYSLIDKMNHYREFVVAGSEQPLHLVQYRPRDVLEQERSEIVSIIDKIVLSEAVFVSRDLIDITEGRVPPSL